MDGRTKFAWMHKTSLAVTAALHECVPATLLSNHPFSSAQRSFLSCPPQSDLNR